MSDSAIFFFWRGNMIFFDFKGSRLLFQFFLLNGKDSNRAKYSMGMEIRNFKKSYFEVPMQEKLCGRVYFYSNCSDRL